MDFVERGPAAERRAFGDLVDPEYPARTTTEVKALLKLAVERERCSAASMVEVLVPDFAIAHGLAGRDPHQPASKGATRTR
ncbi:MAG: hypothetical protein U9R74_13740 [Pseudomonadota bacterium]|nr:hypothetical protein [Pseudomonadota bacterium]